VWDFCFQIQRLSRTFKFCTNLLPKGKNAELFLGLQKPSIIKSYIWMWLDNPLALWMQFWVRSIVSCSMYPVNGRSYMHCTLMRALYYIIFSLSNARWYHPLSESAGAQWINQAICSVNPLSCIAPYCALSYYFLLAPDDLTRWRSHLRD
jgi:hypothetical protein